jgi:hypothetical protein
VAVALQQWLVLALSIGAAIVGLILAASGETGTMYAAGLLLFAAAVIYAFMLIKRHFDQIDHLRH